MRQLVFKEEAKKDIGEAIVGVKNNSWNLANPFLKKSRNI
jgi:hypothetical protein